MKCDPRVLAASVCVLASVAGCEGPLASAPEEMGEHIGVIPYSPDGVPSCPLGPDRQAVLIVLDAEHDTGCSSRTGDRGEPPWVLPDALKYPPPCTTPRSTPVKLCRIDGSAFRPMTTDPSRSEEFYAVLKLGARCPGGAIEVTKRIDNEDDGNDNSHLGPIEPNESVAPPLGTYTKLFFCLFRSAPAVDQTMAGFPDLGLPYGVYHDFEGRQPRWVLGKRWEYSDDEDSQSTSRRPYGPSSAGDAITSLMAIIEDTDANTYFDMARVR